MKMNKILSAALAGVMALSLMVPAFAAETEVTMDGLADGATVEVTGTTQTATVKILVPATGEVILNPYELDCTVPGAASPVQDQIISATQYIVNESNLPVKVSTKVTGTIEGAEFSATSAVAETTKKVNLQFGIGATSAKDTEPGTFDTRALAKTETAFADITMDKKGGTNPAVGYKFSGDASKNPDTPWTTDDVVGATIAFTFKLEGNSGGGGSTTAASVSLDNSTLNVANGGTGTLTATYNAGTSGLTVTKYDWASDATGVATVTAGGSATDTSTTVTWVAAGTANVTVTVTLSNNSTVTATCAVTCDT